MHRPSLRLSLWMHPIPGTFAWTELKHVSHAIFIALFPISSSVELHRFGSHQPCFTLPSLAFWCLQCTPKGVSEAVSNIFLLSFCCRQASHRGRRPEIDSSGLGLNFLVSKASGSQFAFKASYFPVKLLDSPSFLFNWAKRLSIIRQLSLPTWILTCFPSLPLGLRLSYFPSYTLPCSYTLNRTYVSRMISFSLFKHTVRMPSNSAEFSWQCQISLPHTWQQRSEGPCLSLFFFVLKRSWEKVRTATALVTTTITVNIPRALTVPSSTRTITLGPIDTILNEKWKRTPNPTTFAPFIEAVPAAREVADGSAEDELLFAFSSACSCLYLEPRTISVPETITTVESLSSIYLGNLLTKSPADQNPDR